MWIGPQFSVILGGKCVPCFSKSKFADLTPPRKSAARMWHRPQLKALEGSRDIQIQSKEGHEQSKIHSTLAGSTPKGKVALLAFIPRHEHVVLARVNILCGGSPVQWARSGARQVWREGKKNAKALTGILGATAQVKAEAKEKERLSNIVARVWNSTLCRRVEIFVHQRGIARFLFPGCCLVSAPLFSQWFAVALAPHRFPFTHTFIMAIVYSTEGAVRTTAVSPVSLIFYISRSSFL